MSGRLKHPVGRVAARKETAPDWYGRGFAHAFAVRASVARHSAAGRILVLARPAYAAELQSVAVLGSVYAGELALARRAGDFVHPFAVHATAASPASVEKRPFRALPVAVVERLAVAGLGSAAPR